MAQISPVRTPNTMLRIILWCSFFEWGCLGIGLFITENPTKNTQSSSCYGLKSSNFCSVFLRASAIVQLGGAENATPPRNARSSAESEKKPHGRELQEA
ncbi:hypothetical protein TB1_005175 [Malus domestica]